MHRNPVDPDEAATRKAHRDAIDRAEAMATSTAVVRPSTTNAIVADLATATPLSQLWPLLSAVADWHADDYNPHKAYLCACFSELAYLPTASDEWSQPPRAQIIAPSLLRPAIVRSRLDIDVARSLAPLELRAEVFTTKRFVYVIVKVMDFVVVAIRGTSTWRDVWIDSDFWFASGPAGYVHAGFKEEADIVWPELEPLIEAAKSVYFTGHSLGAALAAMLTGRAANTEPAINPAAVRQPYLYASPRFGTARETSLVPRYHHVHQFDLVPHLPPRSFWYSDAGAEPIGVPAGKFLAPGIWALLRGVFTLWKRPHKIEGYRAELGKMIGQSFSEQSYVDALDAQRLLRD